MTDAAELELLPLSALNHLVYCERRCALIHIEGVFEENAFTLGGSVLHETTDTPGYETRSGVRMIRALPLYSRRLGLSGKADIVEFSPGPRGRELPFPIDYNRGPRRRWDNDDVQLCAQALCLEEMLSVEVPGGAIFHAASKRRREVEFTRHLRDATLQAARRLHELVREACIPRAVLMPKCEGCSLKGVCLPELSQRAGSARIASRALFEPQ